MSQTTVNHPAASTADEPDEPGSSSTSDPAWPESDEPPAEPEPAAAPVIEIASMTGLTHGVDEAWLHAHLAQAVEALTHAVARVSVLIVDDARMTAYHQAHCDIDDTTDVLTFAAVAAPEPIEADLVVCADEAARRAGERGHRVERELLLYALHGVLHCAGHDDHDEQAYEAMHAEEDRILDAIGIGATFHEDREASS